MAKVVFEPVENGAQITFKCPRCGRLTGDVRVINFDVEPVLTGNGAWVEVWFLKVYATCDGCEWTGTRAVGKFKAKAAGRLAKEVA